MDILSYQSQNSSIKKKKKKSFRHTRHSSETIAWTTDLKVSHLQRYVKIKYKQSKCAWMHAHCSLIFLRIKK